MNQYMYVTSIRDLNNSFWTKAIVTQSQPLALR